MEIVGLLAAILGCLGYHFEIWWIFYIMGGIAAILDIISILSGELRCFGTIITVACWCGGYKVTGSIWDGIVLGSCFSTILMLGIALVSPLIMIVIGGILNVFEWIKNCFNKHE